MLVPAHPPLLGGARSGARPARDLRCRLEGAHTGARRGCADLAALVAALQALASVGVRDWRAASPTYPPPLRRKSEGALTRIPDSRSARCVYAGPRSTRYSRHGVVAAAVAPPRHGSTNDRLTIAR